VLEHIAAERRQLDAAESRREPLDHG